jgi:hypothetical protein
MLCAHTHKYMVSLSASLHVDTVICGSLLQISSREIVEEWKK